MIFEIYPYLLRHLGRFASFQLIQLHPLVNLPISDLSLHYDSQLFTERIPHYISAALNTSHSSRTTLSRRLTQVAITLSHSCPFVFLLISSFKILRVARVFRHLRVREMTSTFSRHCSILQIFVNFSINFAL